MSARSWAAAPGRTWRRFRRRPRSMQVRTIGTVIAVLAATTAWIAAAPSSPTRSANTSTASHTAADAALASASTSARGVSAHQINVVFPVVALQNLAAAQGFAGDVEFTEQVQAIHLYVDEINHAGGINGRTINPIISRFDPTSATGMRARCKDWTEGDPAAFAVLDGLGDWTGDQQLCVTQEGHTPFIGQWTTVNDWLGRGAPYLWWTGPDESRVLATVVQWGKQAGLIGAGQKVGVIAGDRASDQLALTQVRADLAAIGETPVVATIAADPSQAATAGTQAPLVVQQLRSAGVTSVIPLIPFNVFFPVLQAQTQQQWFPHLLLSDYESSVQFALGLVPIPYEAALDGQQGITTFSLGASDDDRPEAKGGYNPGARACYATWHRAYPAIPAGSTTPTLEAQGPVLGWCQVIKLFAAAARSAGPNLNRRTFVQALARTSRFDGTWTPTLSYAPGRYAGPTTYRVVRLHNNDPKHDACPRTYANIAQGTCWQITSTWHPLAS